MSHETMIEDTVFQENLGLLKGIAKDVLLERFVAIQGSKILELNQDLALFMAYTYEEGPGILPGFNSAHYALGATIAYKLITDSLEFRELPNPPVSRETLENYAKQQKLLLLDGNARDFLIWLKETAHRFVPQLTTFFEARVPEGESMPAEMYWGMVDSAYTIGIQTGKIK